MSTHTSQSGTRVFLWLLGLTLVALAGFIVYVATRDGGGGSGTLAPGLKDDDHVRGASSRARVFVEDSDFECPACLAAQPALRSLYAEFAGHSKSLYSTKTSALELAPLTWSSSFSPGARVPLPPPPSRVAT